MNAFLNKKILFILLVGLVGRSHIYSQENTSVNKLSHSVGIELTDVIYTFFEGENTSTYNSYQFNNNEVNLNPASLLYRFHFNQKFAIRTKGAYFIQKNGAPPLQASSEQTTKATFSNFGIGFQKHETFKRLMVYYGVDYGYTHFLYSQKWESNIQEEYEKKQNSIIPFLGVSYQISKHLCISAESGGQIGFFKEFIHNSDMDQGLEVSFNKKPIIAVLFHF